MNRHPKSGNALDLVQIQAKLDQSPEKRVWRGLDELAGTPEYRDFLACEFPHDPRADAKGVSRRSALKLMAASAALAGLTACTKLPTEKIVPYAQQQPEDFVPGKPLFYATAMPLAGYATGLLVESHMGRPTKVEGNPSHPASLGAANVFAQASVLSLYDPDRAQVVIYRRPHWGLEHVPHLDGPESRRAPRPEGCGVAHSDRHGDFALARGPNPLGARAVPAGEVASI